MSDTNTITQPPAMSLSKVALLLSHVARWQILRELAKGEALPTSDLGRRAGMRPNATSRHLSTMRRMGLLSKGYGGLYSLVPAYRPAPGTATIDFGHCVIRLDTPVS